MLQHCEVVQSVLWVQAVHSDIAAEPAGRQDTARVEYNTGLVRLPVAEQAVAGGGVLLHIPQLHAVPPRLHRSGSASFISMTS